MSDESGEGARLSLELTRTERHDVFTPLNQIIGYCELLIEESQDGGAENPLPTLRKIDTAAKNLNRMLVEIFGRAR